MSLTVDSRDQGKPTEIVISTIQMEIKVYWCDSHDLVPSRVPSHPRERGYAVREYPS